MVWYEILPIILGGGSVIYLIVDRLFNWRHDKAVAHGREIETSSQIADLYKQVDEIVQSKTSPLENKLDKALSELNDIKHHWCCYRENCDTRILFPQDETAQ